jgi:hypothetical protein
MNVLDWNELNGIEWDWKGLGRIGMNWIGLTWIDLDWIDLNCVASRTDMGWQSKGW